GRGSVGGYDGRDRERQAASESGLHQTRGRDCGPMSIWHLYQPGDHDGKGRGECHADGVIDGWKILFLPAPEFHEQHDLAGGSLLATSRAGKFSILSEIPVFERLRK